MGDTPHGFTYYGKSADGVEMALSLPLDGLTTPKDIADYCKQVVSEMKAAGFVRSDRLDKPAYGGGGWKGGQQQAEEPPPADLVVHEHCGEPMRYVKERPANGEKAAVAAHWDCRKGRNCAEARTVGDRKFPFTNWHLTKKPAGENAPPTNGNSTSQNGASKLMNWTQFWAKATPLGIKQTDVTRIIEAMGLTKPTLTDADGERVIDRFKAEQGIAVGA